VIRAYEANGWHGSSPRVRGMRPSRSRVARWPGIIPACAGNAHEHPDCGHRGWDHPRVCGECPTGSPQSMPGRGSSPRVRGMLPRQFAPLPQHGIIPACAGNAASMTSTTLNVPDHPRVCGECACRTASRAIQVGSSPRVRGMRSAGDGPGLCRGITPACAGNAPHSGPSKIGTPDHPRVCGECMTKTGADSALFGSSPRVRGMREALR